MPAEGRSVPLVQVVTEIEGHVAGDGWDQGPRLFALAPTSDLLSREPGLADQLRLEEDGAPVPGQLTPVEQDVPARDLEDLLATIAWPATVVGCALALERIVLPPDAESGMPPRPAEAAAWAARHPDRADVRLVVAVMRDGARSSVLRVRGQGDLLRDTDLAPDLADALAATFAD